MYNPNWNKWLRASVNKHFTEKLSTYSPRIEGVKPIDMSLDDMCEIRMDGPYYSELNKNFFDIVLEVIILVQTAITPSKNLYKHDVTLGTVCESFTDIPVLKLGPDSGDDSSQIGCLTLVSAPQNSVRVIDYGQVEVASLVRQAVVKGQYRIQL